MTAAKRRPAEPRPAADPEALTREERRRLDKAERKLASPNRALAVAGQRELRDLDRRRAERRQSQSLAAGLAETMALAHARGEEVRAESVRVSAPLLDDRGARVVRHGLPVYRQETVSRVRIASRGGLQLAFERGDLGGGVVKDERLLEVGRAYRWAYETTASLRTPARNLAPIGGRSPLRASAGPQEVVFAAAELLRVFRAGLTARQTAVLDQVCGLDSTIRAAAVALKADPRTVRRALVEALAQADANRRAAKGSGAITKSAGAIANFA
ncbi:MAG TPA: hypothetical protein VME40_15025 [Caulobacteraceae bacterium]|nr:hypothetical protein [Caulobacteraceae bacterium]